MLRFVTFTYQGYRGTVTSTGFVQWRTLSCQHDALVGGLRDMVNAMMARFALVA
jgi:hypothetical protein